MPSPTRETLFKDRLNRKADEVEPKLVESKALSVYAKTLQTFATWVEERTVGAHVEIQRYVGGVRFIVVHNTRKRPGLHPDGDVTFKEVLGHLNINRDKRVVLYLVEGETVQVQSAEELMDRLVEFIPILIEVVAKVHAMWVTPIPAWAGDQTRLDRAISGVLT